MSLGRKLGILGVAIASSVILFQGMNHRDNLGGQSTASNSTKSESAPADALNREVAKDDGIAGWKVSDYPQAKSQADLKQMLEEKLPGLEVAAIEKSPIKGYFQVFYDSELLYVSVDGRFLFTGTMIELGKDFPINHSQRALAQADKRRAPVRAKLIAGIEEKDMVVFKAPQEKHVVTVFTDVDCAYCRKLHKEMPALNAEGITVRYMAYPRAGIGSDAYRKLVSVWCSEDKQAAMNEAKLNRKFSDNSCKSPVASQYNLVRKLHLSGTPAVITESGEVIGGYLSASDMIGLLDSLKLEGEEMASSGS